MKPASDWTVGNRLRPPTDLPVTIDVVAEHPRHQPSQCTKRCGLILLSCRVRPPRAILIERYSHDVPANRLLRLRTPDCPCCDGALCKRLRTRRRSPYLGAMAFR